MVSTMPCGWDRDQRIFFGEIDARAERKGISIFQERTSSTPLNFTGNGGMAITGTFYAAGAPMNVTGNGVGDVIGSQYISYTMTMNGGGTFNINWSAGLTAPIRQYGLVE